MELSLPAETKIDSANSLPVYHLEIPYLVSLGDLNNDGADDIVKVSEPQLKPEDEMSCVDSSCTTFFEFNNYFVGFSHDQALGGVIGNAGDLDDDGICELYFVPDWFTSSWTGLNIYSYKNNKWTKIASGSIRRGDGEPDQTMYLDYEKRIVKHNKEYFELLENVMDEDGNEKLVPKRFNL